ncbi:MAG: zinc-dependent metalloprotease, partial [Pirellulales bacterium]|nr:zinc-dependent metalloprotease [Pirellulales bacterium]
MTKVYTIAAFACFTLLGGTATFAQDTSDGDKPADKEAGDKQWATKTTPAKTTTTPTKTTTTSTATKKPSTFEVLTKDAKSAKGYMTLHQKGTKLYGEISSKHLNKDLIVLISIARGIGQGSLLGGMSWGFGDDWIWQFRKVDKNIQVIRRNVRFVAKPGTPEANAVKLAYTDSVMFSLPIITKSPTGADVVDLSTIFMSDLPQISQVLRGFAFDRTRSTWAAVKAFKRNCELEVSAVYRSTGTLNIPTVADSRSATINVHYSISELPNTGYKPRLADDRVGYFKTVVKDFSKKDAKDRFVQYINRWHLEKKDPSLAMSPPKEPIIFYLEKTIPIKYRKPIKDGILEWNKAFEKCGFIDAIEVRQQRDDDDWDPEDINYNTFRWITSGAGFAMGPSRVNPKTGQILDADIILDADFLQYWKQEFATFTPKSIAEMTGGPVDLETYHREMAARPKHFGHNQWCNCQKSTGMARQLALGATAMMANGKPGVDLEKFIMQALKDVTMHEVGHTLGLRHNFKASTYLTVTEANDPKNAGKPLAASVMDYTATNIVPKDMKQGDYFTTTIGPYDHWAIEYGYSTKPTSELKKLLQRSGESALAYTTDEDTRGIDPDPHSNRWDFGRNTLEFAAVRAQLVKELWPGIVDRVTKE